MIAIKTEKVQEMMNKAIKICSSESESPLTSLVEVKVEAGYLHITTTDTVINFSIAEKVDSEENMRVVVDAKLLTSLVNKITTPEIRFHINENSLIVEGNGVYYLQIRLDDSGEVITFPDIKEVSGEGIDIDFKELNRRLEIAKSSIPTLFDAKEMNNYYLASNIITSDVFKISSIPNIEPLKNMELFIERTLGNAFIALGLEKGKLFYDKETSILTILDTNYTIQSVIGRGRDIYPLNGILDMISSSYAHNAQINKNELLNLLDRALLFVGDYDKNGINLTFKPNRLTVTSVNGAVKEDIKYGEANVDGLVEFNALVDIKNLKDQLDVLPEEKVTMYFGDNERAIKMVQKDIIQVSAILEED